MTTQTTYVLDKSGGEISMLRDILIRIHQVAGPNMHTYKNGVRETDAQKLERVVDMAWAAMKESPAIMGILGYGGSEAHRNILGGTGSLA